MVKKNEKYDDLLTIIVDSEKDDTDISSEDLIDKKKNNIDKVSDCVNQGCDSDDEMINNFDKMCDDLLLKITEDFRQQRDEIKKLKLKYNQDIKKAYKKKKPKKIKKATGFTKSEKVPDCLAKLIGIKKGTVLPRTQVTKKVYEYIRINKLYYEKNKRVLRANKMLLDIFDLPESVNNSINERDENGLNFFNIQKHISKCYEKNN